MHAFTTAEPDAVFWLVLTLLLVLDFVFLLWLANGHSASAEPGQFQEEQQYQDNSRRDNNTRTIPGGTTMTHVSLANIRRHPADRLTISGLSRGIAQAFTIAPGLVPLTCRLFSCGLASKTEIPHPGEQNRLVGQVSNLPLQKAFQCGIPKKPTRERGLVRLMWLLLYALVNGAPVAVADGVLADGLIGWVYLGWLLTGGSLVVNFYLFAWAFTPDADGQRSSRPLRLWLVLFFVPLVAMSGLALLAP
jgi:hypothetical protein